MLCRWPWRDVSCRCAQRCGPVGGLGVLSDGLLEPAAMMMSWPYRRSPERAMLSRLDSLRPGRGEAHGPVTALKAQGARVETGLKLCCIELRLGWGRAGAALSWAELNLSSNSVRTQFGLNRTSRTHDKLSNAITRGQNAVTRDRKGS